MGDADPKQERLQKVLEAIAGGASIRAACKAVGMSSQTLWAAVQENPKEWAWAREMQAHADASRIDEAVGELLEGAREGSLTHEQVGAYRAAIEALRLTAARKHPKVYAERVEIEQTGNVSPTVVHVVLGKPPEPPALDVGVLREIPEEAGK